MLSWIQQLFLRRKPIPVHPVLTKFNELRDANLRYDEIFGPGNWHYIERGQPYAKVGDIVTCENGHKICRVVKRIQVGDECKDCLKFEYAQQEPPLGTIRSIGCEICGASWWWFGNLFHFDDGWRVGR